MRNFFKNKIIILFLIFSIIFFVPTQTAQAGDALGTVLSVLTTVVAVAAVIIQPELALTMGAFLIADGSVIGLTGVITTIALTGSVSTGIIACVTGLVCPDGQNGGVILLPTTTELATSCNFQIPVTFYIPRLNEQVDESDRQVAIYRFTQPTSVTQAVLNDWFINQIPASVGDGWMDACTYNYYTGGEYSETLCSTEGSYKISSESTRLVTLNYSDFCLGNVCEFTDATVPENSYVAYVAKILGNYSYSAQTIIGGISEGYIADSVDTRPNKFLNNDDNPSYAYFPPYNNTIGNAIVGPYQVGTPDCPVCDNGANNYPDCNTCTTPLKWSVLSSSCVDTTGKCTNDVCNNGANNCPDCTTCTPPYTMVNNVCATPTKIDGVCSSPAVHFTCAFGTSINNAGGATAYTWSCAGVNGGATDSCSEPKSQYSCTNLPSNANNFAAPDNTDLTSNTSYTYSAVGDTPTKCEFNCNIGYMWNGASCVATTCPNGANNPPTCTFSAPSTTSATCTVSPTTLNWENTGTTRYYLVTKVDGVETPHWVLNANSYSLTTSPGKTYQFWVHSCTAQDVCTWNEVSPVTTFTCPTLNTLTITKAGTGGGTVTSSPAGINCGSSCSIPYASGIPVSLTATPNGSSQFTSWSGDTDCNDGSVTMNSSKTCIATFNLTPANPTQADLTVQNLSVSGNLTAGNSLSFSATIRNQGAGLSENFTKPFANVLALLVKELNK